MKEKIIKNNKSIIYGYKKYESGSITVFLTMLFLLIFSLFLVTFENARILSSESFMRVSAQSAAMATFGDYNRELYEEYGLFAYGGYDGKMLSTWKNQIQENVVENICYLPDSAIRSYVDLYRIKNAMVDVKNIASLMDEEIFMGQITEYLKSSGIHLIEDRISQNMKSSNEMQLYKEKLTTTTEYEQGKYDLEGEEQENSKSKENSTKSKNTGLEVKKEVNKDSKENSSLKKENENKMKPEEQEDALKKDSAGGNPLKTFQCAMRDGVLGLVCDEKKLSRDTVPEIQREDISSRTIQEQEKKDKKKEPTASDYLQDVIKNNTQTDENDNSPNLLKNTKEKINLITYANQIFSRYGKEMEKKTKYGLEYLIAGKEDEKDNLAYVVNRLLAVRFGINILYVLSDPLFQEKSLATATLLAGFTGLPPVINAVQYTILMILAFEESCVDVAALLENKSIPLIKNSSNFRMKYEEICLGNRRLFQTKANTYPDENGKLLSGNMTYQQYLTGLLLLISQKDCICRMQDLIQYDLRERFNQSFNLTDTICHSEYEVRYEMPFVFIDFTKMFDNDELINIPERKVEVSYGYKSK